MKDSKQRPCNLAVVLLMTAAPAWACSPYRSAELRPGETEVLEREKSPVLPPQIASAPIDGAPIPVLILQDGIVPEGADGAPVDRLNSPFTNGLGQVAFTGALDRDGMLDYFVWFDGSILWLNSEHADDGLDGAESTLGVSDSAQFVFGTLADGVDSLWSHQGRVLAAGMEAPGFPAGSVIEVLARATMTPSGRFYSFAEVRSPLRAGMKRRETLSRVLFGSAGVGQEIVPVIKSGDEVDGAVIAYVDGLGLDYEVSDNGEHVIHVARVIDPEIGRRPVPAVYADDLLPMRRGDPTENGAMSDFDLVAINDEGHYLVAGETDGDPDGDYFIAYDGVPILWEASSMPTSVLNRLTPPAVVRGLSIDNRGRAVHAWSTAGFGTEYLFFACDAADLEDSVLLLQSQTKIIFDAGGEVTARVSKFNGGNGPTLSLSDEDKIYIEVDLIYSGGERLESILELQLPPCQPPGSS